MTFSAARLPGRRALLLSMALWGASVLPQVAQAQATAFTQSLAASASADEAIAEWYRTTGYETLWTGPEDAARRAAFLTAIASADLHGLPKARYDAAALTAALGAAVTEGDRGRVEVEMTRAYLAWAHDLSSGALTPKDVDGGILREITRPDPQASLRALVADPQAALDGLMPTSAVYVQLMKAKLDLEAQVATGGWGEPLAMVTLAPGDTGPDVVALRDRL
ncbi:MAG TPA: murein L,D-transpeptidase, partial [Tabrizicola sp.]|nr:murein L,D-transpeptidase [Tabrizicola sp.]